jgi:hypothetical protein
LKFSTVFGATSGQNSATISPSLVLITATSFVEFIGFFSSALTDATTSAAASKLIKIDFMPEKWRKFPNLRNQTKASWNLFYL